MVDVVRSQALEQHQQNKKRQRQLSPPTPGLQYEPVEPFEADAPDEPWRAWHHSGQKIEGSTDSQRYHYATLRKRFALLVDPDILLRRTIGDEQNGRLRFPNPAQNLGQIRWIRRPLPDIGDDDARKVLAQGVGGALRDARPGAEQEES
jgi:hypothetical protein